MDDGANPRLAAYGSTPNGVEPALPRRTRSRPVLSGSAHVPSLRLRFAYGPGVVSLWSLLWPSSAAGPPTQEVRAEIWSLGARHRGEVVEGAMLELTFPNITHARARLLRAVIKQSREDEARGG
jgi:hypothetical protein